MDGAIVYILECSDGSLYCGSTRKEMDERFSEHQNGLYKRSYTFKRRPLKLIWSEHFTNITDAVDCERRLKGWSRERKLAMIGDDWKRVSELSWNAERRQFQTTTSILRQAQDEVVGVTSNSYSNQSMLGVKP